jgi:hypothetical protein
MPAASKSNIHGHIHGKGSFGLSTPEVLKKFVLTTSTLSGVDMGVTTYTPDVTGDIGLPGLRPGTGCDRRYWTLRPSP